MRPAPLHDVTTNCVGSCGTPRGSIRSGRLFQIAEGAPLLSPMSPEHRFHVGDPKVTLDPTPGMLYY